MKKIDALIVGAGSAGSLAAKTTAKAGLSILIIDSKPSEMVGDKICGDAVGEFHFENLGLDAPNNGVVECKVKGIKIYSPDKESEFTFTRPDYMGYILNRRLFGQWLLKGALDAGSEFMDSTMFMEPIIENDAVCGVVAKTRSGDRVSLRAEVVVDASGYYGVVRNSLPRAMGFEGRLADEDVDVCYREIRQLQGEMVNPEYCHIYLNQRNTPGGYTWFFPRANGQVNVGLGVNMREHVNPAKRYYETVASLPLLKGSSILHKGGGLEPTRRPLDRLVGNGVAMVGDAACLVNPINGGGIGISMESGYQAGKAIIYALENGGASEGNLWGYSYMLMQSFGKEMANLEVLRRCIISMDDGSLNYGMKNKLVSERDINRASGGEKFNVNILSNILRVFRGIRNPSLLNKLRITSKYMVQLLSHYEDYPRSPDGFRNWQVKTVGLIDQVRNSIQG